MNRVEISGGLTRDPEFRVTDYGLAIMEMTVAVNGARWDGKEKRQVVTTQHVAVVCLGHVAESVSELSVGRGDEVLVLGELDQSTFEKKDGTKESKTKVVAMRVDAVRVRGPMADNVPHPEEDPF